MVQDFFHPQYVGALSKEMDGNMRTKIDHGDL